MTVPEFSRPIEAMRLGTEPATYKITATAKERAALAERFDLLALERLEAEVRLARLAGGLIHLTARFAAEPVQRCVVTLDPVPSRIEDRFTLLYGDEPATSTADDDLIEPLDAGRIDIGEAVAQQLSLTLDPFPRSPAAAAVADAEPERHSPFADLAKRQKTR
jgi:uncharacterized metal-binding protein YceD (DUF177 family)